MPLDAKNEIEKLIRLGLVPIWLNDTKAPIERDWQKISHRTPLQFNAARPQFASNIGLQTGTILYPIEERAKPLLFRVLDIDVKCNDDREFRQSVKLTEDWLDKNLPLWSEMVTVQHSIGLSRHIYFTTHDNDMIKPQKFYPFTIVNPKYSRAVADRERMNNNNIHPYLVRIECYGAGNQVVTVGSIHPKTKRTYEFRNDARILSPQSFVSPDQMFTWDNSKIIAPMVSEVDLRTTQLEKQKSVALSLKILHHLADSNSGHALQWQCLSAAYDAFSGDYEGLNLVCDAFPLRYGRDSHIELAKYYSDIRRRGNRDGNGNLRSDYRSLFIVAKHALIDNIAETWAQQFVLNNFIGQHWRENLIDEHRNEKWAMSDRSRIAGEDLQIDNFLKFNQFNVKTFEIWAGEVGG